MGWLIGGMLLGGLFKGISRASQYNAEYQMAREDAQATIEEYNRKLEQELDWLDTNFDIDKDEANKKADKQDAQSTLNEVYTANDFNAGVDQIGANQEAEALAFNKQAQEGAKATGDALSNNAASGTRSGSMNTAIDLESAMNSMQLQAAEDQARAGDNIQLTKLFNDLTKGTNQIQTDRTDALDLRKNYLEGGNQWTLWQKRRDMAQNDTAAAISQVQTQMDRASKNWGKGIFNAFLGGFGSGAGTAANLGFTFSNWKNPAGGKS